MPLYAIATSQPLEKERHVQLVVTFNLIKFWHYQIFVSSKLNTLQALLSYQILVFLEASSLKTVSKFGKGIKTNKANTIKILVMSKCAKIC